MAARQVGSIPTYSTKHCPCGVIGSRDGLKIRSLIGCRFESGQGHQIYGVCSLIVKVFDCESKGCQLESGRTPHKIMQQSLHKVLVDILGSEELAERWWQTPNPHLDMEIPDDLMHTSRKREVYELVLAQLQ